MQNEEGNKEKVMFETDGVVDRAAYRWVMMYFNKKKLILSRINLILCPIYGVLSYFVLHEKMLALILLAGGAAANLLQYIVTPKTLDKVAEVLEKNGENRNHYTFYETYVERTNASGTMIFKYEDLCALRENAAYFAYWSEPNRIIVLNKPVIEEKEQAFLRGLVSGTAAEVYEKKIKKKILMEQIVMTILGLGIAVMICWKILGA